MSQKFLAFFALAGFVSLAAAAHVESCSEQVEKLAADHGLAVDVPSLPKSSRGDETSQKLAQSGGVVRPPDVGESRAMPPPAMGDRMPTTRGPQASHEGMAASAREAQAESLLQAANNDARRGDEAGCQAKLAEAQGQLADLPANRR